MDEKPQTQALERKAPVLPLRPASRKSAATTTSGTARPACSPLWRLRPARSPAPHPQHRHEEFLAFLKQVAKAYPRVRLHIVCYNYAHAHPPRRTRLAGQAPPDHAALHADVRVVANMVEVFFGIITRQAIRRPSFTSVKDLICSAIEAFIGGSNEPLPPLHLDQHHTQGCCFNATQ